MLTDLLLQSTQKVDSSHLDSLNNILDKYNKSYENLAFMGDFNITMGDKFMIDFYELNDLSIIIEKPTCYKNFDKPTCNFLTVTEFKMGFQKLKPQVITYHN